MSKVDWFRRTTWTHVDREDFNLRLQRSRSAANKAQYLRIQAFHLSEAGHHEGAIELLDRLFADFPERIQLAQAHAQKAYSLGKLGQITSAIDEYRFALQAERDFPNVRTQAWVDFGWFVIEEQLANFYDEVLHVLQEFRDKAGLDFPATGYRYFAIQSLIADTRREELKAREFAKQALAEATKRHSGLRYHPTVGLVTEHSKFEDRLKALAGS